MNINWIIKEINWEITVAIGITNLGKYTFPKIGALVTNVFEVVVNDVAKYVHAIFPHM